MFFIYFYPYLNPHQSFIRVPKLSVHENGTFGNKIKFLAHVNNAFATAKHCFATANPWVAILAILLRCGEATFVAAKCFAMAKCFAKAKVLFTGAKARSWFFPPS